MSNRRRWIKPPEADSTIEPFRDGVGELIQDGAVVGHLAATLSEFWSPFSPLRNQWWVWLVAVWPDGSRERSIEDYPPGSYVEQLRSGFIECDEWSPSRRGRYEVRWPSASEADAVRARLSITPADF